MKRLFRLSFLAVAACACQSSGPAPTTTTAAPAAEPSATPKSIDPASLKTLTLDPAQSKFDFVAAKITKSHDGAFKQYSGTATVVGDDLHSVVVEVETASIEADDPKLTGHLKTADFLDVEKFPKATFKSSNITKKAAAGATHEVTGALTLHGVTQQITFPVTVNVAPTAVTASGQVTIDRQKFAVTYPGMPDDLIK
ncbi:MAG TPA: YceI family protein, partial [Polyangiaceae bacterium]|nr:YceI family protein [Polyangiaceae bacterium]